VRVIPVLDLLGGRAVLARGGRRAAYAPVRSALVPDETAGDPLALARAYRDTLGCDEWYVADLDAIGGAAPQRALVRALAGLGGRLLVDQGVYEAGPARDVLADGAVRVVIGLETLPSFAALADVARAVGPERLVFGLDLRDGQPLVRSGALPVRPSHHPSPEDVVSAAVEAGAAAILVLDLARVGSGRGVDLDLLAAIRRAHPAVELLAGGGIGAVRDAERLGAIGCDGVLVATALHDGRLAKPGIEALRRRGGAPRRADHASDSR
jgi:phosphoribosylformimino-5-aminoimidazole carboxamide ribotide isomerase